MKTGRYLICVIFCLSQWYSGLSQAVGDANIVSPGRVPADRISTLDLPEILESRGQLGGVTVDRLGFIYVANFRDKVWKVSPDGKLTLLSDALYGASGNTVDQQGNLYQANFLGNSITKIDRFGLGSNLPVSGLNGPVGMVFDEDGNLFVCNCSGNTIQKISPKMESTVFLSGELLNCPNSITTDADGNFYIANFNNDHIIKVEPSGKAVIFATIPGAEGNAHIAYLKNHFYVTQIKTNALIKIGPNGEFSTLISGTSGPADVDGPLSEASLSRPNGICADPTGKYLYINTLKGEWSGNKPSQIFLRRVELISLREVFEQKLNTEGLEAAVAAYHTYKADPLRKDEDTGPETGSLGWALMSSGKFNEATTVFHLLAESYPDRWLPQYYLGEVYKIFGQNDKAIPYYEKVLQMNPGHQGATAKLKELRK